MMKSPFSANNPPQDAFVLLPCPSLEDFPTQHMGQQAAGLLIGWSVLWHPEIIAITGKKPAWQRADSPPEDLSGALIIVPEASEADLPTGRVMRAQEQQQALVRFVHGQSRQEIADSLLDQSLPNDDRVQDFYALAYAYLQVQLMTLQLRYSSNLDESYFSDQLIAAASAWRQEQDEQCRDALHNCYDLLSQERDHAFSADPSLIDLTLLADSTLGNALTQALAGEQPDNYLFEASLLQRMADVNPTAFERLRSRVATKQIGIAGGTSGPALELDLLTAEAAIEQLASARRQYVDMLGDAPDAFACFSGGLPGDLANVLIELGYKGAIFADFAGGESSGHEEAKLLWQSGNAELPALCCTPLDAADPQAFLGLGPRLGEAVDAGQIATALLVHWPGNACFAYDDLRRASSWGLVLGEFKTLDAYFAKGERPFHLFHPAAGNTDGKWLAHRVHHRVADPLSSQAVTVRQLLARQNIDSCQALGQLIGAAEQADAPTEHSTDQSTNASTEHSANASSEHSAEQTSVRLQQVARSLVTAIGMTPASSHGSGSGSDQSRADSIPAASAHVILNPHSHALRQHVPLTGFPPSAGGPIYAGIETGQTSVAVVDAPSCGYAIAQPGTQPPKQARWFRRPKALGDAEGLRNDFIDVKLNPNTGGVASVYTPRVRSNRFSWQLVHCQPEHTQQKCSTMRQLSSKLISSNPAAAHIQNQVEIRSADEQLAALATIDYRLELGSRMLQIDVQLDPRLPFTEDPWRSYLGARIAWPLESALPKRIMRDQVRTSAARNLIATQGVWIDQSDQSILVTAGGLPAHRCVGSQMLDTLLLVAGETQNACRLAYGFDVKNPVALARQTMAPAIAIPCDGKPSAASAWLFHIDSPSVIATQWNVQVAGDGRRHVDVRLMETMGRKSNTTLTCFANIHSAAVIDLLGEPVRELKPVADRISVKMASHESLTIRLEI